MKKLILLLLGIVLLFIGCNKNTEYEDRSVIVNAIVTEIDTDQDLDTHRYEHRYYGDYTVDGKEYTHKLLDTKYTDSSFSGSYVGDTMEIRVKRDKPNRRSTDGGLFIVGGVVLIVFGIVAIKEQRLE